MNRGKISGSETKPFLYKEKKKNSFPLLYGLVSMMRIYLLGCDHFDLCLEAFVSLIHGI